MLGLVRAHKGHFSQLNFQHVVDLLRFRGLAARAGVGIHAAARRPHSLRLLGDGLAQRERVCGGGRDVF